MPLIRRRDEWLNEPIEALDRHLEIHKGKKAAAWQTLDAKALEFVIGEIAMCESDPRYYLENYHAIKTENEGLTTLYPFWDSQEMFWDVMVQEQARRAGMAKLLILKARQLGMCLDPDTKVLTADMRWVRIDDVHPGDEIFAVDEGETITGRRRRLTREQRERRENKQIRLSLDMPRAARRASRKLRVAIVEKRRDVHKKAFRLTMDDGRHLVATAEHRLLFLQRGGVEPVWRSVSDAQVGDAIRFVTSTWAPMDVEDAWFGGLLDGEGCYRTKGAKVGGCEISVAQVDGAVLARARAYLQARGYHFREEIDNREGGVGSKLGSKPVHKLVLSRMNEIFRLLGQCRPVRFISQRPWLGKDMPGKQSGIGWSRVISIEELPKQRMVDLQTSTKTFIAEGFVSHNSTISEAYQFCRSIFIPAHNALIVAQDPDQSDYLFGMSRLAYNMLPWWMQPDIQYEVKQQLMVFDKKDPVERSMYPGLQSAIYVQAANKLGAVGIGKTYRSLHASEVSDWGPNAGNILMTQIFPAMKGAKDLFAVLESTARGKGNIWYSMWKDAENGLTDWTPIFIPPYVVRKYSLPIPKGEVFERTDEEAAMAKKILDEKGDVLTDEFLNWWRSIVAESVTLTGDEWKAHQEFPNTAADAFQNSGTCYFNKRKLQRVMQLDACKPVWFGEIFLDSKHLDRPKFPKPLRRYSPKEKLPTREKIGGRLWVWEMPERGAEYQIAGDVAYGIEGGDFSVGAVWKIGKGQVPDTQVAEWRGWIPPEQFGHVLAALGYFYNEAEIACEVNDCGKTVNNELYRVIGYPRLYQWKYLDKMTNIYSNFFGWQTNHKSRTDLIANMMQVIEAETARFRSEDLVDELMSFGTANEASTRVEGQDGHDDLTFASMIALYTAHEMDWGNPRFGKEEKNARMSETVQFTETDFSPVHDVPGRQRDLHYKQGVPAEFVHEKALYSSMDLGGQADPDDWRNW